jgi:plasmid maintenance system antidote protein VapI
MTRAQRAMTKWLKATPPGTARAVAKAAGTSVPHLRHIAAGRRRVSAELAQRLARAAGWPMLNQLDLCEACHKCPLV